MGSSASSDWVGAELGDLLDYVQPSKYIVESTDYNDSYKTPVLTTGKSFIKGYTNETQNIFENLPVIIFDDFTTASQFVSFKFKVKSSAMKILVPSSELVNIKYVFYFMRTIRQNADTHKRYWISIFSKLLIKRPPLVEQRAIIKEIESRFSVCDRLYQEIERSLQKAEALRQSILKKAFEGRLLTESELAACRAALDWEPAQQLLARIQAQTSQGPRR